MALRKSSFTIKEADVDQASNLPPEEKELDRQLKALANQPRAERLQQLTTYALSDFPRLIQLEALLQKTNFARSKFNTAELRDDFSLALKTSYILINSYCELNRTDREQFLRACELHNETEIALILLNRHSDLIKNLNAITQDINQELVPKKTVKVMQHINALTADHPAEQLAKLLQIVSIDPLTNVVMKEQMITPQGTTFAKRTLDNWFYPSYGPNNFLCPLSSKPLTEADLLPNHLARRLQETTLKLENMEQIKAHLICPLSELPFIEPHVAADGETYELRSIKAYLEEHNNKTPQGIEQDRPLYPNRLVRDLSLVALYSEAQLAVLINVNNYLTIVSKEPDQFLGRMGIAYSKKDKSSTVLRLIRVIMGLEPEDIFWNDSRARAILDQGRAADAAKPAINYLQQIRVH